MSKPVLEADEIIRYDVVLLLLYETTIDSYASLSLSLCVFEDMHNRLLMVLLRCTISELSIVISKRSTFLLRLQRPVMLPIGCCRTLLLHVEYVVDMPRHLCIVL
jgi:hypothetical protein